MIVDEINRHYLSRQRWMALILGESMNLQIGLKLATICLFCPKNKHKRFVRYSSGLDTKYPICSYTILYHFLLKKGPRSSHGKL